MTRILTAASLLAFFFLLGCATEPKVGPWLVHWDAQVKRSHVSIPTAPDCITGAHLTAIMYPLEIVQDMDRRQTVSRTVSGILWDRFRAENIFPDLDYVRHKWPGLERARQEAAVHGADLIITGTVPYLFFSGSQGMTSASIHLEIYDAATGSRLWSMDHAGTISGRTDEDYILVRRQLRMPQSPIYSVLQVLACDLAKPLKGWNRTEAEAMAQEEESPDFGRWWEEIRLNL